MPLVLSDRLQADLVFLGTLTPEFLSEFCKVCLDSVEHGVKQAMFTRAAAALRADVETVTAGVMALSELLLEAAKNGASEADLVAALYDITALPETHRTLIASFYAANEAALRGHLASVDATGPTLPQYTQLDWRLQVTVASRHAYDRMDPSFTLRLDTLAPPATAAGAAAAAAAAPSGSTGAAATAAVSPSGDAVLAAGGGGVPSSLFATADYAALKRVADALDEAAAELKTAHARRVIRYIH